MVLDLGEGRVLIVDDTPANIQLLGPILKEEGYKLVIATNGAKAIEIANKTNPDLILLDINMPEMDGYETCQKLKESNETKDIAIIFLSGNVEKEEIQKGYDWLVLARRAAKLPTREYEVPLEGKVPYDFRKIEKFAKVLNSEIDKSDAVDLAKRQIEESHRYLAQQNVDRIAEFKSVMKITQTSYLHAPIWFVKYNYKDKKYQLWIDGATGTAIKGEIPSTGFGII